MLRKITTALASLGKCFLGWLYVPKCVSCGRILEDKESVFCADCRLPYQEEKRRVCSRCFSVRERCICAPLSLERAGLSRLVKLYRYYPRKQGCPGNDIIYRLKREHLAAVTDFLANELVNASAATVECIGSYSVAYAPRSRAAINRYGYDHMRILAKKYADLLGLPLVHAIKRKGRSKAQKKLSISERKKNVQGMFAPAPSVDLKGKSVLLLDDIVTTGSTLIECARVLRAMGAKRIVCVVIAVSGRDNPSPPKRYSIKMHKKQHPLP